MKKGSHQLTLAIIISAFIISPIYSPSYAFDLGGALSKAVDKQLNKTKNRVEQNIAQSLTKSFPKLAKHAKLDDGRPVDLSKGVYVFGYNGCPPSRSAYSFMKKNNVKYVLMDVEKNKKAIRIAKEQGLPGSPTVFINGERVIGYSPNAYTNLLKKHKKMK